MMMPGSASRAISMTCPQTGSRCGRASRPAKLDPSLETHEYMHPQGSHSELLQQGRRCSRKRWND